MKNLFNSVKVFRPKSSKFDLSHDVKLSCNMGKLVPIMLVDCVPGDKVSLSCEALVRFAPLVAPMMHRVNVTMHYFFVPMRLLWPNWENYITNTEVDDALPAFPTITYGGGVQAYTALMDYLGLPQNLGAETETVSAFPFAAYQLVFNEYYRDQNLVAEVPFELTDGDNTANADLFVLRTRAWEHDYFTASLPFAQKGDAVEIPISGVVTLTDDTASNIVRNADRSGAAQTTTGKGLIVGATTAPLQNDPNGGATPGAVIDPNGQWEVANAETTINDLRRATALQKFLEKLARGGSRYIETIRSMFGVNSSDKRLQRPEYITGSKTPVIISEVLNTTGTTEAPQGSMAGHGVSATSGDYGSYYCEEHGYVIGIMSIMPATAYQQGIPKHFLKTNDPYEFYFPDFANIGEQEVKAKEVYAFQGVPGNATWGYVPRYAEYKFQNNRVAGDFRSTLNFWHMGRIFDAPPGLNQAFIEADPTFRVFAVTDENEDHMWCHVYNKVYMRRLMPKYGTPTF